ncbi:hypothetical protein SADUNF_Sadunf15G0066900 [Salix dunnii]|uniref:K Homology domain-containing protein n=1 Tax=Salix dunnii TaxID=1413687 RepID=A0A835JDV6_9ROSI|nr:hypothetical protein SADUNF_Sadunf15G0066900 [Salix dunnii]
MTYLQDLKEIRTRDTSFNFPESSKDLPRVYASGKAAEFGALKDGYMFKYSTGLSRMLLSSTRPVLEALGKKLSFEIAGGLNGRVWV